MTIRILQASLLFLCIGPLKAIDIQVSSVGPSTCGGPDGYIGVEVIGGIPPFSITLTNGVGTVVDQYSTTFTFQSWNSLFPGAYTVSVVDANMDMASVGPLGVDISAGGTLYLQSIATCPGEPPIALVNMFENGIVDIWGPDVINSSQQVDLCGQFTYRALMFPDYGTYALQYQDVNGCIREAYAALDGPVTLPTVQVAGVTGSCNNGANGSITVLFGGVGAFPPVVTRLKNSAGAVVSGACPGAGIELAGLIGTPYTFTGLAPGTYWVHVSGQTYNFDFTDWYDYQCRDSIEVVVPALPGDCGVVNGRVFVDNNANCLTNSGENSVPATVVRLEPGPYFGNTNSSGQYSVQVPYGTYDVFAEHPALEQACPVVQAVQQAVQNNVNVPMATGAPLDMQTYISDGVARPGFEYQMSVQARNLTAAAAGTVSLVVEHDALLTLVSETPNPTSTAGNVLTWSGGTFSFTNAFQTRTVQLRFQVPPDVGLLGTDLVTTATISSTNTDTDLSNNSFVLQRTVTGAYDPNDKLATTSGGNTSVWQLGEDEWVDYTIRFQNTGTDTAFNVLITDTLPANLDPGTIIMGAASHNFTWGLRGAGTLKFYFPNILLPDSNINEPRSHGFVGFRIRPHEGLAIGDQITNIANIYFDFNPPVITEPSVLNVVSPVRLDASAWLGGAYDAQAAQLRDDLRSQGLLPTTEPYSALGYTHSGGGGGETIAPALLTTTGPSAIVDWVLLELRDPAQPATVLHSRSALLRRDGRITDKDGTSPVAFNAPPGNYRIALQHRNHLGVVSAAPITLGSIATTWDLRTTASTLFGTTPTNVTGSTRLLWPGDGNRNGQIKYTGAANDRDPILSAIGGSLPTNTINGIYSALDTNLDGQIRYTGSGNDRDIILQTIGGTVPTAVRVQQLP